MTGKANFRGLVLPLPTFIPPPPSSWYQRWAGKFTNQEFTKKTMSQCPMWIQFDSIYNVKRAIPRCDEIIIDEVELGICLIHHYSLGFFTFQRFFRTCQPLNFCKIAQLDFSRIAFLLSQLPDSPLKEVCTYSYAYIVENRIVIQTNGNKWVVSLACIVPKPIKA